jgi:hypothetical protein
MPIPFTHIALLLLLLLPSSLYSQEQALRGRVMDSETLFLLEGATVTVFRDSADVLGSMWCENGEFRFENIPVGKIRLRVTLMGYKERVMDNIAVNSAKEVVLEILLEATGVVLKEIEIRAKRDGAVHHEMAPVSAREFSVEETDRYAGSRGDPARMASNFAGVQGADDSRNDIVIRGNSPQSVLWRLEGIDIPNPNHFNIPGTAGGPVSIINNKYLANSEFYTGAFPADFGNSLGGVFNLKMRNGNNETFEGSAQLGFLGTELLLEGPLGSNRKSAKSGASFLVNYRYSTVELFSVLGIDIGSDAVPQYQDASFRLYFPGKKRDALTIWGIGGKSSVDILISDQISPGQRNIYGQNDRDQYFSSTMGVLGASYQKTVNENTFFRFHVGVMGDLVDSYHELVYRQIDNSGVYRVDSLTPIQDYRFSQGKQSAHFALHHKAGRGYTVRAGIMVDRHCWNMQDSVRVIDTSAVNYYLWTTRWNTTAGAFFFQPYVQVKKKISPYLDAIAGIHSSIFTLNNSVSPIEPRLGLTYSKNPYHTFAFGAGLHTQLQQGYLYFYEPDSRGTINRGMDFTYSAQLILSHEWQGKGQVRVKTEVYVQELSNVPIEKNPSSFSLLNTGAGFSRFFPGELVNRGSGKNVGAEITVEKFFSAGWLFLFTASVFDSNYKGSDGVTRNTDFNGRYAANILMSKEWSVKKKNALILGSKLTTAGGRWYGPADI